MNLKRQVASSSGRPESGVKLIVKRFDAPEKVLVLDKGRLELITVGGMIIGKGSYSPGWRWSHAAPASARPGDGPPNMRVWSCPAEPRSRSMRARRSTSLPGTFSILRPSTIVG